MAEKGEKLSEADVVENTVKSWLGNPISRSLLKLVSARGKNGSRLDLALRKYAGENVNLGFADKISYLIVKTAISKGSKPFNISKEEIKLFLKEPFVRRGVTNIIEGVAHFGVQRPQTCAVPFLIVWDFTHACNLKCKHCYQEADKTMPDELSTEEAKRAIDQLAEAGVPAIAFSGGEPLTRKDFFEVAKYAKDKEFYVSLATNGTLITKEVAQKLKKIVDYVEISMDGFESMHDNFRGIRGVWKMTYNGIKNCVDVGLDTCVATTVTKWNLEDIPKLIDFVEKDLKANRMIFFNFIPTRRGKNIADRDISPEERETAEVSLLKTDRQKIQAGCVLNRTPVCTGGLRIFLRRSFCDDPLHRQGDNGSFEGKDGDIGRIHRRLRMCQVIRSTGA